MSLNSFNVVISFDTTGSMSGCLNEVKRNVNKLIDELFQKIPNISIGIVAHGDYGDENYSYLMKSVDITNDKDKIIKFINEVGRSGGNWYAAYDYVLKEVQNFSWTSGSMRALIMIGDSIPRELNDNPKKIDWRNEVKEINSLGINIYSIQCLNMGNGAIKTFYKYMANNTNGYHLYLDQFSYINDIILAICYKHLSKEELEKYEEDLQKNYLTGMSKNMREIFDIMLGRQTTEEIEVINNNTYDYSYTPIIISKKVRRSKNDIDLTKLKEEDFVMKPSPPARFQILLVNDDQDIKTFTETNNLTFEQGKGYYEFTKPEIISKTKEIILQNKNDGLLYEGLKARKMLKLIDYDQTKKIKCTEFPDYRIFIQSSSHNRKLLKDTYFLYDVL